MMRLPEFTLHRPASIAEAVRMAADLGPEARFVAGGTDVYPNMKRRHQRPAHVISLARIPELSGIERADDGALHIGAMTRLSVLERAAELQRGHRAVADAVASVSTPLLRNMGTFGGNLLLDTRCNYYDQSHEWRASINFCMKCDGDTCWVAPSSPRCWAVQSSDSVPLLCAMDAEATLVSPEGERRVPVRELYRDDGIRYLDLRPAELLTRVHLPAPGEWRASYRKLRRRGTFDFPVLGVGVCVHRRGQAIDELRIRIGGAGSAPIAATAAEEMLRGAVPTEELIAGAAQTAFKPTRAMDNTDHEARWRKKMAPVFVARALRDCLREG